MPLQTERESAAFLWEISNSRNKKGEVYRERPSVAGIYTFLDFETPQQEAWWNQAIWQSGSGLGNPKILHLSAWMQS